MAKLFLFFQTKNFLLRKKGILQFFFFLKSSWICSNANCNFSLLLKLLHLLTNCSINIDIFTTLRSEVWFPTKLSIKYWNLFSFCLQSSFSNSFGKSDSQAFTTTWYMFCSLQTFKIFPRSRKDWNKDKYLQHSRFLFTFFSSQH